MLWMLKMKVAFVVKRCHNVVHRRAASRLRASKSVWAKKFILTFAVLGIIGSLTACDIQGVFGTSEATRALPCQSTPSSSDASAPHVDSTATPCRTTPVSSSTEIRGSGEITYLTPDPTQTIAGWNGRKAIWRTAQQSQNLFMKEGSNGPGYNDPIPIGIVGYFTLNGNMVYGMPKDASKTGGIEVEGTVLIVEKISDNSGVSHLLVTFGLNNGTYVVDLGFGAKVRGGTHQLNGGVAKILNTGQVAELLTASYGKNVLFDIVTDPNLTNRPSVIETIPAAKALIHDITFGKVFQPVIQNDKLQSPSDVAVLGDIVWSASDSYALYGKYFGS